MPKRKKTLPKGKKLIGRNVLYVIGIALCVVLLAVVVTVKFRPGGDENTGSTEPGEYGFEFGTQGWTFRVYSDSMAITSIAPHTDNAKEGSKCLQCTVNMIGGHPNNSKGEVYVDVAKHPPLGVTGPVNLTNKTVSVWLYLPAEAIGDPSKPNGIQLFFKDTDFKSKYTSWKNIGTPILVDGVISMEVDQWTPVIVDMATESWAWDEDCDLTQVGEIGIKIGAGGGSTENFSGTFLIDAFKWD